LGAPHLTAAKRAITVSFCEVAVSVAPVASLPHPLVCAVEQIEGALDRMPVEGWSGLESVTLRESAERLMRVEARVKAQLMAVTRALDETGLAKASGASSTGAMLAASFGGDRRATDGLINQAKELDRAPATGDALARGAIGPAQAAIIARAVADLPDDTTPEQKQACPHADRRRRPVLAQGPAVEVDAHHRPVQARARGRPDRERQP
jgi:hypothetical protein